MAGLDRRRFLKRSAQAGALLAAGTNLQKSADAVSPNEQIVLGVVGVRGRGSRLAEDFAKRPDCHVAYLADVDASLFASRAASVAKAQGKAPKTAQDFRRVLDDPSVDAIVVATPDHWHALATVWGCMAKKDVYVEKPASHTPWEGGKMVEAARKHRRVVQVGLQSRSAPYNQKAKAYLDAGKLGKIHMARVYNQKNWPNATAAPDRPTPDGLDWDMWNGPAPEVAYNPNYHNRWNHFWRYSGGDIINDGVHQMDLARWLIGKDYPKTVYSTGGRWGKEGVFETPDTQIAVFQYDDMVMTFELTLNTPYMLKTPMEIRQADRFPYWPQNATRIEIYGTEGVMVVGRHGGGWQVFGKPEDNKPVVVAQEFGRFPDPEHKQNFVDALRSREKPNADVLEGHRSTLLCQYANISYRLGGRKLQIDPKTEQFVGAEDANAMLRREYRSPWVVPDAV